jgi:hypothetical protein
LSVNFSKLSDENVYAYKNGKGITYLLEEAFKRLRNFENMVFCLKGNTAVVRY